MSSYQADPQIHFKPQHLRIPDLIESEFYRQKYDAEKALEAFADAARSETNLESLSAELVNVVRDTLQAEQVSFRQMPNKSLQPGNKTP